MKIIKKVWRHLIFKMLVFFNKLIFSHRFKKFGSNTIISPILFNGKNLEYVSLGDRVEFKYGTRIETFPEYCFEGTPQILIGNGTKVETLFHIGCCKSIIIGQDVLIGSNVFISDHNHSYFDKSRPILSQGIYSKGQIIIGKNTWIGNNVTILGNVTIGENCVIGANSVVTKSIPNFSIVAGCPAKIINTI